jgi:GH15 family glucan-1,4-alpha-glucosidase
MPRRPLQRIQAITVARRYFIDRQTKRFPPFAFVASPTMPWAFGTGLINPSTVYHAVWSRDLYEIVPPGATPWF